MRVLSGLIQEPCGAVIEIIVDIDGPRAALLKRHGMTAPTPVAVRAQIDTGSALSAIDQSVIESLELKPVGKRKVLTPSTPKDKPHVCNEYAVSISLHHKGDQQTVYYGTMVVIETEFHTEEGIHAMVGRDILRSHDFFYSGRSGTFTLHL
jgi:hypothetical protein